jgi:hypothetical protein
MNDMSDGYSPFLGLLQRWFSRQSAALLAPLWLIVAFGIALPLFNHPAGIAALIGLSGVVAGVMLGGVDRAAGSEEYMMALPPSRSLCYWTRALAGCTVPLAALLGLLIVRYNVASHFWGLFCSSGWSAARRTSASGMAYAVAFIVPLTLYLVAYAGASLGGVAAGMLMAIAMPLVALCCAFVEGILWQRPSGMITLPVLGVIGCLAPLLAYPLYLKRDIASRSARNQMGIVVVLLVVAVLVLFFSLTSVKYVNYSQDVDRGEPLRKEAKQAERATREVEMTNAIGGEE